LFGDGLYPKKGAGEKRIQLATDHSLEEEWKCIATQTISTIQLQLTLTFFELTLITIHL